MVDVDVDDLNDRSLHLATQSEEHEKMLLILKSGRCDPNAFGLYGWAPLHKVAAKGDLDCAAFLLQHGAALYRRNLVTIGIVPTHSCLNMVIQIWCNCC